ncbi:hypothetical protein ACS0TY_000056 [Phlomoides rotata]
MADAAVEFLLENIQQLLLYHTSLISNAKEQVEKLDNDLRLFKAFLRDSTSHREQFRELLPQSFSDACQAPHHRQKSEASMEIIRANLILPVSTSEMGTLMNLRPIVTQENIVGFEDETTKLLGYLTEETQQFDVISIIGMPGLGKTTLARKIFRDPKFRYEFPHPDMGVYFTRVYKEGGLSQHSQRVHQAQ